MSSARPVASKRVASPSRAPKRIASRSARRRRAENTSASADGRSSHWASSTTQTMGRSSAATASKPSTATEISRRSVFVDGAIPSAPASAWDWISGSSARLPRTGRSSWCSPANARSASASTPLAESTRIGPACCLA